MTENIERLTSKAKELKKEDAQWFLESAIDLAREMIRLNYSREDIRELSNNRLKNRSDFPQHISFGRACGILQGLVHKNLSIERKLLNQEKKKENIEVTKQGLVLDTENQLTLNFEIDSEYTEDEYQDLLEARKEFERMKAQQMEEDYKKSLQEDLERGGREKVLEERGDIL